MSKFKTNILVMLLLCLSAKSFGANDKGITKLATRIVELRSNVESLNTEHLALKTELTNDLKGKGARAASLEGQIANEEVRLKQINNKIKVAKKELSKISDSGDDLKPLLITKLDTLVNRIDNGLPFQTEKRLKDLTDIKSKLESGIITSESAFGRMWAHLEDEMRLTRENALHRQTIVLNGEERLATVAKIGMMMMYFHTSDNLVGYVSKDSNGNYIFIEETQKKRKDAIFTLVDGLKKQIRYGKYTLPLAKI